jgi:HTH-type transcriptional regulator, sugar sensing transcriptional regulator
VEGTKLATHEFARDLAFWYTVDDNRQHMKTITTMLTALGLPEKSQAVYLDLLAHGPSAARAVALRLGHPRSSLYDHVRPLLARGLVCEEEHNSKAVFAIHDITDLDRLVAQEAESLTLLRSQFAKEKATFAAALGASGEPRIKFVEGREGVSSLLLEMLWDTKSEIATVWPYAAMLEVLTAEDLELFNRKRIRQNIALKTIWTGPRPGRQHLFRGGDFKVERRAAPAKYAAPMAYNIYGDKVSFFSSAGELYGFVVHSADFAKLMSAQFAALWEVSKAEGKKSS